jgi:hypothetical protein
MTKDEFLRAWDSDPYGLPLPAVEIPVSWMRAAWKIEAIRFTFLDLLGQNVNKRGRLGYTEAFLNLLDRSLTRAQVHEIYRGLRDFEPHREREFREDFERGFPTKSDGLPPVRTDEQLVALLGPEMADWLGVVPKGKDVSSLDSSAPST